MSIVGRFDDVPDFGWRSISFLLALASLSTFGQTHAALAADAYPVALVIEASPSVKPTQRPFSELSDGARLELGAEGVVHLLHYYRCEELIIRGGDLTVTVLASSRKGGEVIKQQSKPCPKQVNVAPTSAVSGLVLRGFEKPNAVAERPMIVFVGDGQSRVERVDVLIDGQKLHQFEMAGPAIEWPTDAAPLKIGTVYILALTDGDGAELGAVQVMPTVNTGSPVLIRVD